MQKYSHIISRQIFEVKCSSEKKGRELQDKISFLFNTQLQARMDALFEDIVPQNKHLRIENLTIDVGNISYESLDYELINQIMEKLEREISLLLLHDNRAGDQDTEQHATDQTGSYLSLLEYFLLRGTLPWWAGSEQYDSPLVAFDFLLSHNPQDLAKLIMRIGQKPYVRKRLVYQLQEGQIKALIGILEPSQAEFIFDYHAEVINTQRKTLLVKNEETEFKKAVWDFIILFLIVDRGSHFNRKEFVKSTLMSIAANFNVSFEGLLNLFASAIIPGSSHLKNVDSIQAIILEIAVEKNVQTSERPVVGNILEIPVETPETGVDLLRYYLTFGSFPWWSANVTEADLQQVIVVLNRKYPRTLESLIQSVGQREYSRKLIVKTFTEDTLKDILVTIEPENAEFINDYVQEVKTTHVKTSVLKTQTESLREALWEFILEYLLVDRGSEFNRQIFLESNIKKLANRYNINFKDLVVFMVNNIAVAHSKSSRHLNLFQGLTNLYHQNTERLDPGADKPRAVNLNDTGTDRVISKTRLLDVLYFWIKMGYKPWWAGRYTDTSPSALIEEMIREVPLDAITFLKHAGMQVKMRKRLIYQVPFQTLIKLFQLLPAVADTIIYAPALLVSLRGSKIIKYSDQTIADRILVLSLWESLASGAYRAVNPVHFVSSVISNLAVWFQVPVQKLIASIKTDQAGKLAPIMSAVHRHLEHYEGGAVIHGTDFTEDWTAEEIEGLIASQSSSDTDRREETFRIGLSILLTFLQTGKLPRQFQNYSQSSVNAFLKALVLLLFDVRASDLKGLLESHTYQAEHFLRIYELFSVSNSIAESGVARLLQPQLEKNILRYIEQHGYLEQGQSIFSFIDGYIKDSSGRDSLQFLKQLLSYSSVSMQLAYYYKNEIAYDLIGSNFIQTGWGSQTTGFLRSFNSWLLDIVDDPLDRERLDLLFRTFNFMMIGGSVNAGSLKSYLSHLFKFLFERDYQLMLKLANLVKQRRSEDSPANIVLGTSLDDIKLELNSYSGLSELSGELTKQLSEAEALALKQIIPDIGDQRELERKIIEQEADLEDSEKENEKDLFSEKDKIYIHNSGLVILHPFLSTYFNRLQMLDKGDFKNEEIRHRAIHLLQYLAFGKEKSEEHELVLNKLMCNLPVEEPVMSEIELTEHEKVVSAELLNAVIAQWDKLKNSSPESLQVSFIQREGVLYKVEDTWNLKVEQRGYDVLLQTLPWGLGMVKTPWMTNFIVVEWM